MRVSELLGLPAVDADGTSRGQVIEIRTRVEGRPAALVIDSLIIGTRHWRLFGYERRGERGPALFNALARLVHRNTRCVRYSELDVDPGHRVRLRRDWAELPTLHELDRKQDRT